MKTRILFFAVVAILISCSPVDKKTIDLSGEWNFSMDTADVGVKQEWYNKKLSEVVRLPGSLNTNGKGLDVDKDTRWTGNMWNRIWYDGEEYAKYREKGNTKVVFWLQPDKYYTGAAWFQKEIEIPANWDNKQMVLSLERCHWQTSVWVDDKPYGSDNSLSTPHCYLLSDLKPGRHMLSIRVDNRVKEIDPGLDAHSVSDNTQSNWNGIVGSIKLDVRPLAFISSVKIVPDVANKQITAQVYIQNAAQSGTASLSLQATSNSEFVEKVTQDINLNKGENITTVTYPMGNDPKLWDEFSPNLYTLKASLQTADGEDQLKETFGMRSISTRGTQIAINGNPIFIRGTLECCIFPETGFPPTGVKEWERIIKVCKSYGLNNIRFHSWCPPKAAFDAADNLGFYFQIECAAWSPNIGSGLPIDKFVMDESERIVREYGNHPSFCLFAYGNEPGGEHHVEYLTNFVKHWKGKDQRFLTTTAAGWPTIPENDYLCVPEPRLQGWGEGVKSIINSTAPGSNFDWTSRISKTQPTVSHEIGQWCVYPDLKERSKYTGVLKAKNFDIFEDRLRDNDLLNLADSFFMASGKLQVLCYKADIEAALRTKGFGGFQLLDLHDFPGQGTALVGVVDPFWNSKPYVTPQEYNRFNDEVVPLARINRFILSSGETLDAKIQVAQYSSKDILATKVVWKLTDMAGKIEASGEFMGDMPKGRLSDVGEISHKIVTSKANQYKLQVSVYEFTNSWDVWVYPKVPVQAKDVKIATKLDAATATFLEKGGKVLLMPTLGTMKNEGRDSVAVGFSSIFWNTLWTNNQAPHTLGILCNPKHPALAEFPTQYYSNYQWQYAMSHCNAIPLKKLGEDIQPIVRIIDDWFRARSLAMIVELKVGEGKLLICSADLNTKSTDRPEAQQLKNSLLNYMESSAFDPSQVSTVEKVKTLFK